MGEGKRLAGKVALITGSGRGLGRAYARRLATLGADIAVHDQNEAEPARFGEASGPGEVVDELRELGVAAAFFAADVRERAEVARLVGAVADTLGPITILVNNAGGDIGVADGVKPDPNDALGISQADLQAELQRNLLGTIYCCQEVVPGMIARGGGKIVNVASVIAHSAATQEVAYGVAKAGIRQYTRSLSRQVRPYGITVNCISPGATLTTRFRRTRAVDPALEQGPGLARYGRPEDMARVVEFFVSELSDFVSGQTLVVDGGAGAGG